MPSGGAVEKWRVQTQVFAAERALWLMDRRELIDVCRPTAYNNRMEGISIGGQVGV